MTNTTQNVGCGVVLAPFLLLLGALLTVLKLTGMVTWPWAVVLAPLIGLGVLYLIALVLLALAMYGMAHHVGLPTE